MALFYQVFAQVYPAQCERILVKTHIFKVVAPALPEPSLVSIGNFHTLKRSFLTQEQAEKWASSLCQKFSKGPAKNPILGGGQLYLF